jgi:hypothetical protein
MGARRRQRNPFLFMYPCVSGKFCDRKVEDFSWPDHRQGQQDHGLPSRADTELVNDRLR